MDDSDACVLRPVKRRFFRSFLSLHLPNNSLENISIFYLPHFNLVAKNLFLDRTNIRAAFGCSFTPTPRLRLYVTVFIAFHFISGLSVGMWTHRVL
jgi:hypothetical protein